VVGTFLGLGDAYFAKWEMQAVEGEVA
jgi:hypothetical protein